LKQSDYYKQLGVDKSASADEIKRAYRRLARKLHPDVSKEVNAEARFKMLGEAYEVLRDPDKRAAYDRHGPRWAEFSAAQPGAQPKQGAEARPPYGQGPTFNGDGASPEDLFESIFRQEFARQHGATGRGYGHGHRQTHPLNIPGEDRHAKIEITLEDTYQGATRHVMMEVPSVDAHGQPTLAMHSVKFDIPKGIRAGQSIRLAGQGWPGQGDAPAGDLYLDVAFLPHLHYRIDKADVYLDLPITPWEAALGAEIEVPTPGGRVELTVPARSTDGKKMRIKGRGLPAKTPGDFYFVLNVVNPPVLDDQDKAFYESMAKRFTGFHPRAHLGDLR
jgi:curved DNA-binding protein